MMSRVGFVACAAWSLLSLGCDRSGSGGSPGASASSAGAATSITATPTTAAPVTAKDHVGRQKAMVEAFGTHDARRVSALYAEDAVVRWWGMPEAKGRDAIERSAAHTFAAFGDAKLVTGRIWIKDGHTALVESVFTATNTGDYPDMGIAHATSKTVAVAQVSLFEVGDDGLIREERRYCDAPTFAGQISPPDPQNPVRPAVTSPPSGTDVVVSKGTPEEAHLVDDQRAYVAALDTGKLDDVMKLIAPDFVSDDYATPATLEGAKGLRDLLDGTRWDWRRPWRPPQRRCRARRPRR